MKNLEIERLRAMAVLMVMYHHWDGKLFLPSPYFDMGWSGVDLFFVISGFVISRSLFTLLPKLDDSIRFLDRMKKSRDALKIFFYKRFFRIVPLATLWVVIPIAVCEISSRYDIFGQPSDLYKEAAAIFTLRYNFALADGLTDRLGQYWSLMVEEHFYLLFPFFLIAFASKRKRIVGSLLCIGLVALILRPLLPFHNLSELHHVSYKKFDALFAGVLIALLRENNGARWGGVLSSYWGPFISAVGLLGVWCLPGVLSDVQLIHFGVNLIWIFSAFLIYFASFEKGFILKAPVFGKFLEYVGARSFGIYLLHRFSLQILIMVSQAAQGTPMENWMIFTSPIPRYLAWGVLTFAFAEVCFRFIEQPCIRYGAKMVKRWEKKSPQTSYHQPTKASA